ncbi:hypothetical protein JCM17846_26980 [Iodidimonas nitroreducens]|uniref:DUF3035 domain-containing protein n=1 Tax=Iodidimonas nitroreducens TaxID=1236968 RepID=A0A5A7NDL1_9PROT|nr:DUF3035 domain-containing protein [Iodidimonas nitroreducens]GAK34226.1 hypothetical protein AQ1_02123 [alpha proteobacterium Q-1]GER05016.1 hypothetical protein JCM17846_26980 [Iodidimonas nitroreducens]
MTFSSGLRVLMRLLVSGSVMLALSGCVWVGELVGSGKNPPDEFVVVDKRPLVVPPDFQLRPPRPGVPVPQNIQPTAQVIDALFPGHTSVPPAPSDGEIAFLENFEATSPDVRSQVGGDTETVDKGPMLSELLSMEPRRLESDGATIERIKPKRR